MKKQLKRISEFSGLIATFLIFIGLLKLYTYYNFFHINIIPYLDPSEILLSFFSDPQILITIIIFSFFHGLISYRTINVIDENHPIVETELKNESFKTQVKAVVNKENNPKDGILKAMSFTMAYFYESRTLQFIASIILGVLCWVFYAYYHNHYSTIMLYLLLFTFLQSMTYFTTALLNNQNSANMISLLATLLLFSIQLGYQEYKEKIANSKLDSWEITTDNQIINTDGQNIFIGKTSNYILLFNTRENKTSLIPANSIKEIQFHKSLKSK